MSPFFKNDDSWGSETDDGLNFASNTVFILFRIDGRNYSAIDEIFTSCSGTYYIYCYNNSKKLIPIPIDMVSLPKESSSKDENSFIHQHLEEYKTLMIRTKKLNRITK